ncbi:MAG: hypothetical protein PHQ06_05090 [Atribacterota bacterium]|nr:hypothetical protein [Atribacterota bacterium]
MKKIVLVILLSVFCFSAIVNAEVKFGGWDKWDKELPPENSKNWHWVWPSKKPAEYIIEDFGVLGEDLTILSSDLYYGRKFDMKAVSICFYSFGDAGVNSLDWYISNAVIALAAFPPKERKITIKAYKREDNVFKFFEEWEIEYKVFERIEPEVVVPSESRFIQEFKKWIGSNSCFSPNDISENLLNLILPKIVVSDESFIISTKEVYIKK